MYYITCMYVHEQKRTREDESTFLQTSQGSWVIIFELFDRAKSTLSAASISWIASKWPVNGDDLLDVKSINNFKYSFYEQCEHNNSYSTYCIYT